MVVGMQTLYNFGYQQAFSDWTIKWCSWNQRSSSKKKEKLNFIAISVKMIQIKLLRIAAVWGNQRWRRELTYTSSGVEDLSGSKRFAEQSFHKKLIKTIRGVTKTCYCLVNYHEKPNIGARRSLFVFAKHLKNLPHPKVTKSIPSFLGVKN